MSRVDHGQAGLATVMIRRLVLVSVIVSSVACRDTGLTPAEQLIVGQYLTCIDCVVALDSVRALAGRKSDATVDTLGRALLVGPGAVDSAGAYDVIQTGFARDSAWRAQQGLPPLPDRLSYVGAASALYVDGYRAQGAVALGWIHTPRAVQLLDSALTLPLSRELRRAVLYARDSLPRQR